MKLFNDEYKAFLLELLQIPTVSPFESNRYEPRITQNKKALETIIKFTKKRGLLKEYYDTAPETFFEEVTHQGRKIPAPKQLMQFFQKAPEIREAQPNLVLKAGGNKELKSIICFNAHIDTVAGFPPPEFKNDKFIGRGAVDMKGPLAATIAGIEHATNVEQNLLDEITIRLQVVSGEESGPMGMIGTAVLVDKGYVGRLNVFCEPTSGGYFSTCKTNMTPMLTTKGKDAHDSQPDQGFIARHLLGYTDRYLEKTFIPYVLQTGGSVCLAGMQTEGQNHSRVFGTAFSKINIGYPSMDAADRFKSLFEEEIRKALSDYAVEYGNHSLFRNTARYAKEVTKLEWLKYGIPVLNNSDEEIERNVLQDIPKATGMGIIPFSCDAIWSPPYTIVLGPGDLGKNHAHDDGEYIERDKLEAHAQTVSSIIMKFRDYVIKYA
jgi:acetylornithine deacetylase